MISYHIKGLDELIKNLHNVNVKNEFKDAANQSIAEVHKRIQVEVPIRTGQLKSSHVLSPATMHTAKAEVYTQKEYAVPVHEGHEIVAWGHHTGRRQPPNPWFKRAVDKSMRLIDKIFDESANRVAKIITK
jgi:hypothetical protein